ncbi:MAG: YbaB/EbfC family nucleoid-associated protein [Chloroflexota bacterium]|nr:YbaB/EbfC family nucleoid-associated protein [Chloroflexota bacterium]
MNKQLLRQAQQLQARMAQMEVELESLTVEGTAGGGVVTVTMTGKQAVQKVRIAPEAAEDVEMLQDLVLAAFNDAQAKALELASQKMNAITGGMRIPGLM